MTDRTESRRKLRALVRGTYDLQALRIAMGLRLVANFKARLGFETGVKEEDADEPAKEVIEALYESFRRLTDGVAKNRRLPEREGFSGDNLISDYTELVLVSHYIELARIEAGQFRSFESVLPEFPIYNAWLKNVVGVGPAMAGVILSEFDIEKCRYPSSLWAYSGLDLGADGRGRSRRKEHLVKRTFTDKSGKQSERDSITYNPFLKTKLMGVLAGSFLRTNSPFREHYDNYKHRLQNDPARRQVTNVERAELIAADPSLAPSLWTPGRIHDASKRYMVKAFLKELYIQWRGIERLPIAPSYQEAKLGHIHSHTQTEQTNGSDLRALRTNETSNGVSRGISPEEKDAMPSVLGTTSSDLGAK